MQRGQPLQPIGAGLRLAWEDPKGYVHIKAPPGDPNTRRNGYMFEHVLVMSQMLGRPLLPFEQVTTRTESRTTTGPRTWSCGPDISPRVNASPTL
jgi:hypothetical protein